MDARVTHAERWVSAGPSLLEQMSATRARLPGPDQALLDEFGVSVAAQVTFRKGEARPYPGAWSTTAELETVIAGQAATRDVATDIRRDLLDAGALAIKTSGPDKGREFRYSLATRAAEAADDLAAAGGGE